ncbi:MAG: hypothetical protein F7C34_03480 [Desulfurococcales archaeon]|nr:hypothetical protein [Desulfurococcales archaeon]
MARSPDYKSLLVAVMLALLVTGPFLFYPAKAYTPGETELLDLDLNMRIAKSVSANLSKTHPYIRTLATLAEMARTLKEAPRSSGLEAEDSNLTFNLSKVRLPALAFEGLSDGGAVAEYAYRYILLSNELDFDNLAMNYSINWEDDGPVTYNPGQPETSVFGGGFEHKVVFHIHINQPQLNIDPGAGNAGDLAEIFKEHTSYDVYFLNYKNEGGTFKVSLEKHVDGDEVTIRDYSLYYSVVVQVSYDEKLMNALDAIKPKDGSYVYFAIANVSFTVTYQPSEEVVLSEFSTWDSEDKVIDISNIVYAALDNLKSQILSSPDSLLPEEVKQSLASAVDQWKSRSYTVTTKHILTRVSFTWTILDQYEVYENGSSLGGGTEIVLADHNTTEINNDISGLKQRVLNEADSYLSQYYPGGIAALTADASGVSPVLLYEDSGAIEDLPVGAMSPVKPVTNLSLLFTPYPVKNSQLNGQKSTVKITLEEKADSTDDYELSTSDLIATAHYEDEYQEGNTTYTIVHNYTLYFNISVDVEELDLKVLAKVYDILVWVDVNPEIVAKQVEAVKVGSSRLVPALAPLGGSGLLSMIEGGADEIGIGSVANAVSALESMAINSNFNWVLPTYFPVPMPHESVKVFAPGEYIGAYYMTSKIKLEGGFLSRIGKPLFSVMYEKVSMSLKSYGSGPGDDPNVGVVYMSAGKIKRSTSDELRLYSLGFGVGEIRGKVVGPRFYLTPSGTGLPSDTPPELVSGFLNSSIVQFLTGDNFITDLLDDILPGEIFTAAREIVEQMRDNGLYPQVTPYFGGEGSVWAYFMFSPKNTGRFVANKPGDYLLKVNSQFNMLHVRIFKVPILGIPIPIPVFISKGETQETVIHVRQIKALPLLVNYVVKPASSSSSGGGVIKPLLVRQGFSSDSYVGIYAVPVWVDLDGATPIAPVLFRGHYGTGANATSLTIAAVSPRGTIISGVDVRFFGVPLSFIKIPLNSLERMTPGPEGSILLLPAWKHGQTVSTLGTSGAPTVIRLAKVRTFNLFFYDGKLITYTGVYDPHNKIHYYLRQAEKKIDEIAGMVQEKLAMVNGTLLMVIGKVNTIEGLLSLINSTAGNINQILMQISQQVVNEIMNAMGAMIKQIVGQFVANAVAAVVGAVLPDPTGVISGYIQDIIQNLLSNAMNQIIPGEGSGQINITDLITRYGLQVLTFVALKAAYDMIGYQGLLGLLENVKSVALKGVEMIKRINGAIEYILRIVNNTVEMSKYKPILLSTLHVYSLGGNEIPSAGILAKLAGSSGENLLLPIDAVESNVTGGAVLYTTPYSTLTFILQIITGAETGEYPNIAVSIQDALLYVAAWTNFIASLLGDNAQGLINVYNTLIQVSGQITLTLGKVQEWVEVPGVDTHTIILPTVSIVPPSQI